MGFKFAGTSNNPVRFFLTRIDTASMPTTPARCCEFMKSLPRQWNEALQPTDKIEISMLVTYLRGARCSLDEMKTTIQTLNPAHAKTEVAKQRRQTSKFDKSIAAASDEFVALLSSPNGLVRWFSRTNSKIHLASDAEIVHIALALSGLAKHGVTLPTNAPEACAESLDYVDKKLPCALETIINDSQKREKIRIQAAGFATIAGEAAAAAPNGRAARNRPLSQRAAAQTPAGT